MASDRTAGSSIKGFLYEFHKTLYDVLTSSENENIRVNGIYEDIDIETEDGIETVQCKYHEGQTYSLSSIYKPILYILEGFRKHNTREIVYKLYAYFPNQEQGIKQLKKEDIQKILSTENKELTRKIDIDKIKREVDIDIFLTKFQFEIGMEYQKLKEEIKCQFEQDGLNQSEVEYVFYSNAIEYIANLAIEKEETKRLVNKTTLLNYLRNAKKVVFTKWTKEIIDRSKYLKALKETLKSELGRDVRKRMFILQHDKIDNFISEIVRFINDYLNTYLRPNYRVENIPLFCFQFDTENVNILAKLLHEKKIIANFGHISGTTNFEANLFYREAQIKKEGNKNNWIEFHIRVYLLQDNDLSILLKNRYDEVYVIGDNSNLNFDNTNFTVRYIDIHDINELKYLFRLSNTIN